MKQEIIEVGYNVWKDYSLGHKYSRLSYRTLQMVCPPWLQRVASYQWVSVLCAFSIARTASTQVNFLASSWAQPINITLLSQLGGTEHLDA